MAKLTAAQIRSHASAAGFTGNNLDIAVAVALAESGGNTTAYNGQGRDRSYGLWQINMIGDMGPARRRQFNLKSNDDLYDPAINARAAYGIFKGSGWNAWTTYTRGTYTQFLTEGADATPESSPSTDAPTTDGGIVTGGLNAIGSTLFRSLANMTGVAVALALFIGAIVLFAVQSRTGKRIVKKVGKGVVS